MKNKLWLLIIILLRIAVTQAKRDINPIYSFQAADASIERLAMSPDETFIVAGTSNYTGGEKIFWYNYLE